jgi:translation elongation factor EF-1alpha
MEGGIMSSILVGEVAHYYNKIGVAVLALAGTIQVGDSVHFLGHSTDLRQEVTSLQIEHQPVEMAGPEQEVAMKVERRVRPWDQVFKISDEE